jgi:fluoroquinolone transport system ATP-binding protein
MNGKRRVRLDYGKSAMHSREFDLDTLGTNEEFLDLLKNEHIAAIHSLEAGLDDIFIKTTGTSLN